MRKKSPKKKKNEEVPEFTKEKLEDIYSDLENQDIFLEKKKEEDIEEEIKEKPVKKEKKEEIEDDEYSEKTKKEIKDRKPEMEEELTSIYLNKDGKLPDMTHFEQRKKRRVLVSVFLFLSSIAFLVAVIWGVFFFFKPGSSFSEEKVILSISGDEETVLGGEVRYRIRYRNDQNTKLENAELKVHYPEGFVFKESSVPTVEGGTDTWNLGTIEGFGSGYIDIFGNIFGDKDKEQSLRVFLNYNPINFSSQFQQAANVNVAITESPVEFVVVAEEKAVIGDEVQIVVKLNKDIEYTSKLQLEMKENENFTLKSSSIPSVQFNKYLWDIPAFDESYEMTIIGVFAGEEEESNISFALKGSREGDEEQMFTYATYDQHFALLMTDFVARYVINGSRAELVLQPGEIMNASVFLQNEGDVDIDDIQVVMKYEAPSYNRQSILDWSQITDENNGSIAGEQMDETMRRGIITWNRKNIGSLATLAPKGDISFDVSLPVKDTEKLDLSPFQAYTGKAYIEVQYERDGVREIYSSKPIELVFNSDMALEIRHEKDNKTRELTLLLTNSFHELQNVSLTFDIFGDILWKEDALIVPAGKVDYDSTKKRVTWTVESMPTDVDVLALQMAFDLQTENPTQTDLTSKIQVTAKDAKTGREITLLKEGVKLQEE
ncbi:MAG: hypothetical protein V1848_02560 [Candidatus Magasanikbacteria bacterium]